MHCCISFIFYSATERSSLAFPIANDNSISKSCACKEIESSLTITGEWHRKKLKIISLYVDFNKLKSTFQVSNHSN